MREDHESKEDKEFVMDPGWRRKLLSGCEDTITWSDE